MKKNLKTFCLSAFTVLILVSSVSAEGIWTNYTNGNYINDIAVEGDYIWCATQGGVVRWNMQNGTYVKFTSADGLANNNVRSIAIDADNVKWFATSGGVSSFDEGAVSVENTQDIPTVMDIRGNYPNPFNPSTTISFSIPEQSYITLSVYDITGQKVATLIDKPMSAGSHSVIFDGSDFGSGVYLYRLESKGFSKIGKMLLLK